MCRNRSRDRPRRAGRCSPPSASSPTASIDAGDLVAEREWQRAARGDVELLVAAEREIAVLQMQVGMADAAALDAHQHFAAARGGAVDDGFAQRLPVGDERLAVHFRHCGRLIRTIHAPRSCPRPRQAARARASATKPATEMSSARAVGSRPAAASRAATSTPSERRLWRSILRRWPNAAWVTRLEQPAIAGQRRRPRHQTHQRGCDFRRRHEGRGVDVEQDARLAAPLRQHGQPPVAL